MRRTLSRAILFAAAGLVLLWHTGASAQPDAEVTEEGLHRVDPSIMVAAWVKPGLDLSHYTKILLMPTAIQFRDVPKKQYDPRSAISDTEFPLPKRRQEWLRKTWRRAVEARFSQEESYELTDQVGPDVLVVQGFLVDVVSYIPPVTFGSRVTVVKDPWTANVVLELRDATTAELLARTIDRRNALGQLNVNEVWARTEDLLERWAQVLSDRLGELSRL